MTTLSTGFDYFGICDIVLPSAPVPAPVPAPIIPAPVPPHIIGTFRIYKEQTGVMMGKDYISVYRSDEKNGYVQGHHKKTKVWFSLNSAYRNSYSNRGDGFSITLMPVGHTS